MQKHWKEMVQKKICDKETNSATETYKDMVLKGLIQICTGF